MYNRISTYKLHALKSLLNAHNYVNKLIILLFKIKNAIGPRIDRIELINYVYVSRIIWSRDTRDSVIIYYRIKIIFADVLVGRANK